MKSRFAVSVLFILIAATFTSEATGAFVKLRSRTGRLCARYSVQVCNRVGFHHSAPANTPKAGDEEKAAIARLDFGPQPPSQNCAGNRPCVVGTTSPGSSDHRSESFQVIRTATRQIHEVLDLIRIK
jgi:hypothetical protein